MLRAEGEPVWEGEDVSEGVMVEVWVVEDVCEGDATWVTVTVGVGDIVGVTACDAVRVSLRVCDCEGDAVIDRVVVTVGERVPVAVRLGVTVELEVANWLRVTD